MTGLVDQTSQENTAIPVGRNYQVLLRTLPSFPPTRISNSVPAHPTRSVRYSVNGTSDQNNNAGIDGRPPTIPTLPHVTGIDPALDSIEVVNVVTNSFDAKQGLAGGAAVNLPL